MENFTAKDISTIIRACKDTGLTSLDCGGLKLSFNTEYQEAAPISGGLQLAPFLVGNEKELLEDREVEDNDELRQLELQDMMISDPVGFEKHMRYEDETE